MPSKEKNDKNNYDDYDNTALLQNQILFYWKFAIIIALYKHLINENKLSREQIINGYDYFIHFTNYTNEICWWLMNIHTSQF